MPRERLRKFEVEGRGGIFMEIGSIISSNAPECVVAAMKSRHFGEVLIGTVCGVILGVDNPHDRPAEFLVTEPIIAINSGNFPGVTVRLKGVSRDGRAPKKFHDALNTLHSLVVEKLGLVMTEQPVGDEVQVFVILELDKEVPVDKDSGRYSTILEHEAEIVRSGNGVKITKL
jgi:hypothetical protein